MLAALLRLCWFGFDLGWGWVWHGGWWFVLLMGLVWVWRGLAFDGAWFGFWGFWALGLGWVLGRT